MVLTTESGLMRVHLRRDNGVRINRTLATVKITADEFIVESQNRGTERYSRENHTLTHPQL